jgi:hypothetical protein
MLLVAPSPVGRKHRPMCAIDGARSATRKLLLMQLLLGSSSQSLIGRSSRNRTDVPEEGPSVEMRCKPVRVRGGQRCGILLARPTLVFHGSRE